MQLVEGALINWASQRARAPANSETSSSGQAGAVRVDASQGLATRNALAKILFIRTLHPLGRYLGSPNLACLGMAERFVRRGGLKKGNQLQNKSH